MTSGLIIQDNLIIQTGVGGLHPSIHLIECKGQGHPDTLADDLAERLSRVYAAHTQKQCSAVLHHNFDKLCLLGGESRVSYGGGHLVRPVRALVNGRATPSFGGQGLNVDDLIVETTRRFFGDRLPSLRLDRDLKIELNLSAASSPGRVYADLGRCDGPRHRWFAPRSLNDLPERRALRANDTSFGTGYAPLGTAERLIRDLTDRLSRREHPERPDWMGTDVKVMACQVGDALDIIACVPQIAACVPTRAAYITNLEWTASHCRQWLAEQAPEVRSTIRLNVRDRLEEDEIYLTATGSSIETGDEGVVGRGNRINGIITPLRPMNVEGVNGKNPIYHVGKLYNVLATRMAEDLNRLIEAPVVVNLISSTGGALTKPWRVTVQTSAHAVDPAAISEVVKALCEDLPAMSVALIAGTVRTC